LQLEVRFEEKEVKEEEEEGEDDLGLVGLACLVVVFAPRD
jgi:hypothetical protein